MWPFGKYCLQQTAQSQGGSSSTSNLVGNISEQRGSIGLGKKGRRQVQFGGLNFLYDEDEYEYPVHNEGQIYIPLELEHVVVEPQPNENEKETKKVNILAFSTL